MTTPSNEQKSGASTHANPGAGSMQRDDSRSEALLPADQNDPNLQVAEEVAFDLQSDQSRRVGATPADSSQAHPAEAMAEALRPDGSVDTAQPSRDKGSQQP